MFNLREELTKGLQPENINTDSKVASLKTIRVDHNRKLVDDYVRGTLDGGMVSRLRFDWRIEPSKGDTVQDAINNIYMDILDIIINGDVDDVTDVYRKALDGSRKRGKQPKEGCLIQTVVYAEEKERHTEYVVFALLYLNWD